MQFRYGIAPLRVAKRQNAHAERLALRHPPARHVEELLPVKVELRPQSRQVLLRQPERKFVVASRDRRVSGEDVLPAGDLHGLGPRAVSLDQFAGPLERQKGSVPLVHMPHGRVVPELAEGTHTADPQEHLLHDAMIEIGPIQPCREAAICG